MLRKTYFKSQNENDILVINYDNEITKKNLKKMRQMEKLYILVEKLN